MKTESIFCHALFIISAGHGYNRLTISLEDGTDLSTSTNNTRLTDRIKGTAVGEDPDADEARLEAVELIFSDNGFNVKSVSPEEPQNTRKAGCYVVEYFDAE